MESVESDRLIRRFVYDFGARDEMAAGEPRNQSPVDAPIASHLVVRVLEWPQVTRGLPRMLVLKNGPE